jgi:hypothetical protein
MEQRVYARHGDLVIKTAKVSVVGKKQKQIVLREGEFTGHAHRLTASDGASVIFADDKDTFEVVGGNALLTHEEHQPITFVPGVYTIIMERERDPFTESIRTVVD